MRSYVQNIRNNTNKARTPKWARKAGFIDDTEEIRKKQKSQWSGRFVPPLPPRLAPPFHRSQLTCLRLRCDRYEERLPHSTLENQEYAEDQIADVIANPTDTSSAGAKGKNQPLWREDDEEFYNEDPPAANQQHWHYPVNTEGESAGGDRWDRTVSAHPPKSPFQRSSLL